MKSKIIKSSKELKQGAIVRRIGYGESWGLIGRKNTIPNIPEWYIIDQDGFLYIYETIEEVEANWYYCNLKREICNDDIE